MQAPPAPPLLLGSPSQEGAFDPCRKEVQGAREGKPSALGEIQGFKWQV